MKYRLEHWQPVWERCVAIVDIPDGVDPQEWANDHVEDWIGDAYCENTSSVDSMDSEIVVRMVPWQWPKRRNDDAQRHSG